MLLPAEMIARTRRPSVFVMPCLRTTCSSKSTTGTAGIVGWNLRRLWVEKGLSRERLAFAAGIDRAYVRRIEHGSENVTIGRLEEIAGALDVLVVALFEAPTGDKRPPGLIVNPFYVTRAGRNRH